MASIAIDLLFIDKGVSLCRDCLLKRKKINISFRFLYCWGCYRVLKKIGFVLEVRDTSQP